MIEHTLNERMCLCTNLIRLIDEKSSRQAMTNEKCDPILRVGLFSFGIFVVTALAGLAQGDVQL